MHNALLGLPRYSVTMHAASTSTLPTLQIGAQQHHLLCQADVTLDTTSGVVITVWPSLRISYCPKSCVGEFKRFMHFSVSYLAIIKPVSTIILTPWAAAYATRMHFPTQPRSNTFKESFTFICTTTE